MIDTEKQPSTSLSPGIAGGCMRKSSIIRVWPGELLRQVTIYPPLRALTHPIIHGSEHVAGTGPFIFAANHSSHLDAPLLLAALPLRLRLRLRTAAASDYFFTSWWKGALVSLLFNAFAFERRGFAGLHHAQRLLEHGSSILLFPEGTRSRDGQLQPFKCGIGSLALASQTSVIPVRIEGSYAAMPKGQRRVRRHRVEIWFGAPMQFAPGSDQASVVSAIEQQVQALALAASLAERKGR